MSSFELQHYLQLRADGVSVEDAAEQSTIGLTEALLHEQDIERGELELPHARARAREDEPKEGTMEDVQTTIRVGDGPEVPINLSKDIDDSGIVREALGKPATDTGERLKRFIERAENLDEEIKALNEDKSDLFKEMKFDGFDTKTIKRLIKLRKMEPHVRREAEGLLSTYMDALGMTPIEAAIALAA